MLHPLLRSPHVQENDAFIGAGLFPRIHGGSYDADSTVPPSWAPGKSQPDVAILVA
jgi:hypothetical protein